MKVVDASENERSKSDPSGARSRGERLRAVRRLLGLTQDEMGELVGVHGRSWQDYERGASVPKISVYEALAGQGFSANWLLWGEGEPKGDALSTPVREELAFHGDTADEEVDELMRVLSHPAAVRAYQRGRVPVRVVMAAAMQHAKESDWSADQLARLATLAEVLNLVIEKEDERVESRSSGS